MDHTTVQAIRTAYDLLRAGKQQEAAAILIPIVRANPNIPEAWYLLGFAVNDPEKQLYAFRQVLRIDPSNKDAQGQVDRLMGAQPAKRVVEETQERMTSVSRTAAGEQRRPVKKKRRLPAVAILTGTAALFVCVVGFGIWMVWNNGLPASIQPLPTVGPVSLPTQTLATVAPTLTPTISPSPTPSYEVTFRPKGCTFDVPEGVRTQCGVVSVPQDRTVNYTNRIELPVVIYRSSKPQSDVIIYLQGGPGEESIDWSLGFFDDYVSPILQDYDIVFFDPRGTGRSEPPLSCPELNSLYIDAYFQSRSEEEVFNDFTAAWAKCHERLIGRGVDPAAFNTTQSAADVRDIARSLGYEKVNLLGISYGTRLGLTVMRDYPEVVRAAVLDSVVPMEAKMFNRRSEDVQYALEKVFTDCANSPQCNGAYPDLRNMFYNLVQRFDKSPVTVKIQDPYSGFVYKVKVNGVDMLSAVVAGLHTSELVPVIPKAIYDTQNGDYTFLSFSLGIPGGTYNDMGLGTYFATMCHEQIYATTAQELDADLGQSELIKKFSLASLFGSSERVFQLCQSWGAQQHDPRDSLPVTADIPTLVVSGEYDPTTPVTTGQMVANDLPDNHFYVIPGMGHGATVGNECSMKIMKEFLEDPARAPDVTCLDALQAFEFFLPYNGEQPVDVVPVKDSFMWLEGVIPAGWKRQLPFSTYYRGAYLFDPTLVDFESILAPQEYVFEYLAKSFKDSGFDETPKIFASHYANGLYWRIYRTKFNGQPLIMALASANSRRTMALIMVASAPERDAYYKGLFLPMLDALVVLG
jgi:pimeloyl-ACP methyl ester carboxylesterase